MDVQQSEGELTMAYFLGEMANKTKKEVSYCFTTGCVGEKGLAADLRKPSYNLFIYHDQKLILACYFELDTRFSLEIRQQEMLAIESYMSSEALLAIFMIGFSVLITHADGERFTEITRKESSFKKNLPLN
jgi:hypothetical protein